MVQFCVSVRIKKDSVSEMVLFLIGRFVMCDFVDYSAV